MAKKKPIVVPTINSDLGDGFKIRRQRFIVDIMYIAHDDADNYSENEIQEKVAALHDDETNDSQHIINVKEVKL